MRDNFEGLIDAVAFEEEFVIPHCVEPAARMTNALHGFGFLRKRSEHPFLQRSKLSPSAPDREK